MRYDLAWIFRSFDAALAFLRDGYASGLISEGEHPRIERALGFAHLPLCPTNE